MGGCKLLCTLQFEPTLHFTRLSDPFVPTVMSQGTSLCRQFYPFYYVHTEYLTGKRFTRNLGPKSLIYGVGRILEKPILNSDTVVQAGVPGRRMEHLETYPGPSPSSKPIPLIMRYR